MIFPSTYKILPTFKSINNKQFSLIPIRYEDRLDIMKWRNEQIFHLRQSNHLTERAQTKYFSEVVKGLFSEERPTQILFSFLENGRLIGYGGLVHINWGDKIAEISFIMDTELQEEYFELYWEEYLKCLEVMAFEILDLRKIFTYAFDVRPRLYKALERRCFFLEATLENHCLVEGQEKNVLIHTKTKNKHSFSVREANSNDLLLYLNWANDKKVRKNAIRTEDISIKEHTNWFNKKIESDSKLYVFSFEDEPIGQLRLDVEKKCYLIDYSIDKKFRGRGFGKEIIKFACQLNLPLKAIVKEENVSSIKVFQRNRFIEVDSNDRDLRTFYYSN